MWEASAAYGIRRLSYLSDGQLAANNLLDEAGTLLVIGDLVSFAGETALLAGRLGGGVDGGLGTLDGEDGGRVVLAECHGGLDLDYVHCASCGYSKLSVCSDAP